MKLRSERGSDVARALNATYKEVLTKPAKHSKTHKALNYPIVTELNHRPFQPE